MLKNQLIILLIQLALQQCYCQEINPSYIDSIINVQNNLPGLWEYDYSSLEKSGTLITRFDFIADTSNNQLLKVIYTEEANRVVIATYYFNNNELVKVESMTRDDINHFPAAEYYFSGNKLIGKRGKNLSLQNDKLFKKISVSYIFKQRDFLLKQFQNIMLNEIKRPANNSGEQQE